MTIVVKDSSSNNHKHLDEVATATTSQDERQISAQRNNGTNAVVEERRCHYNYISAPSSVLGRENDYDKNDVVVGCGQGGSQQQQQHSFITRSVNNYSNDEEQEDEENGGNNTMTIPTTKTPITTKVKRWFTSSSTGNDENDEAGNVGYVASLDDVDGKYDDNNSSNNKNNNNNSNDNNNIAVVDNDDLSVSLVCSNDDNGDLEMGNSRGRGNRGNNKTKNKSSKLPWSMSNTLRTTTTIEDESRVMDECSFFYNNMDINYNTNMDITKDNNVATANNISNNSKCNDVRIQQMPCDVTDDDYDKHN
jgi:hypothetical protein